mgnify:CR=1 FL=1
MGKIFGYARISKTDQNLDLQKDSLLNYGAQVIYEEKNSGKNTKRPELAALLKAASSDDIIVVYKLDRISRSTRHLIELAEYFEKNGIQFVSIADFIDTSTPTGRFFFHVIASIAAWERDILIERTHAERTSARLRRRVGDRIKRAIKLYEGKEYSIREIKEMTGVSKSVLYRNLQSLKEKSWCISGQGNY